MKRVLDLILMVFGTFLCASAFGWLILPGNFVAGGVTGLAGLLHIYCPISLSMLILLLNILILIGGFLWIGFEFTIKTVGVSLLFPVLLDITTKWNPFTSLHPILTVVLAGILLGTGTAIIMKAGSSCGGFDTVALIMNKKFNLSLTKVMKTMDITIIGLQVFFKPLRAVIYGILVILITTYMIRLILSMHISKLPMHNSQKRLRTV